MGLVKVQCNVFSLRTKEENVEIRAEGGSFLLIRCDIERRIVINRGLTEVGNKLSEPISPLRHSSSEDSPAYLVDTHFKVRLLRLRELFSKANP